MLRSGASIGVSTAPGHTALTRMPSGANAWAIERVSPSKPAFDEQYAGSIPLPLSASTDAMPTTAAPAPTSRSDGSSSFTSSASARRFTSSTASHAASSMNGTGTAPPTPAACTSPPIGPSA